MRSPVKSSVPAAVAGAAVVALLVACGSNTNSETEGANGGEPATVKVATAVDQYYGYIAVQAHERLGTFTDTDLEVEVISATTPTIGQILAADQAQIALAGAGALVAHGEAGIGVDLTAKILGPWDNYVLVSEEGDYAGAESLEELRGATFGITGEGSPGNFLLNQHAEHLGWTNADFSESALGDMGTLFAALSSGQVDAVIWASDQAYVTEAQGVATHFPIEPLRPNVLQAFGVSSEFAENHPETVKSFLEAYYAKVEDLQANPQEFVDVLIEEWEYDSSVAELIAENQLPLLSTDGSITPEELEGIADSVPFLSGQPEGEPPTIDYTPWQDLGQ